MDMELLHGYGGQKVLDDIVNSYTVSADGNINAGDLCEFINGQIRKTSETIISNVTSTVNGVGTPSYNAIVLDTSRVFITYTSTNSYLWSVVLTINNGVVTVGTPVQLNSISSNTLSNVLMDSTHVIVTYTASYAYALVVTISGTVIATSSPIQTSTTGSISSVVVALTSTIAALYFIGSTNAYIYGIVLTLSGNSLSYSTTIQVSGSANNYIFCKALDSTRVLICQDVSNLFYGIVVTVSSTTMATGSTYSIDSGSYPSDMCFYLIDSTHVLVIYARGGGQTYAVILTINNTTITVGTLTQIYSSLYSSNSNILIDSSHLMLLDVLSNTAYYRILTIVDGSSIVLGTQSTLFGSLTNIYMLPIDSSHVFLIYKSSSNNYMYSTVYGLNGYTLSSNVIARAKQPYVIATTTATSGNTIKGCLKGFVKGLSGLIPNNTYYCDDSGNLTTTQTRLGEKAVGVALSTTELLIPKGFWER